MNAFQMFIPIESLESVLSIGIFYMLQKCFAEGLADALK
jgi:hypothetical protein